jgi:serine/threonine protein phosphatase PrpC
MIEAAGVTDPGCVRSNNEDFLLVAPSLGLYAVADGMGGAKAGEHASRMAVEALSEAIRAAPKPLTKEHLIDAFAAANERVMGAAASNAKMEGMGTTLVAALEIEGELMIASVGDSRAYAFVDGQLRAITDDQSWVNEVGRRLGMDEAVLKNHPMRHVLTMAIGVTDQLRIHTYSIQPAPGTQILLCSDGLHGSANEAEITKILASPDSLESKCQQLVKTARRNGGPDNITAILLKVS